MKPNLVPCPLTSGREELLRDKQFYDPEYSLPQVFASAEDLKKYLDYWRNENFDKEPDVVPADDPGMLIFSFIAYLNKSDETIMCSIPIEFLKRDNVDIKELRNYVMRNKLCNERII